MPHKTRSVVRTLTLSSNKQLIQQRLPRAGGTAIAPVLLPPARQVRGTYRVQHSPVGMTTMDSGGRYLYCPSTKGLAPRPEGPWRARSAPNLDNHQTPTRSPGQKQPNRGRRRPAEGRTPRTGTLQPTLDNSAPLQKKPPSPCCQCETLSRIIGNET